MPEYVRIIPAREKGASETGNDEQWSLRGFDLRSALARVCQIPDGRIELPSGLDNADRYDFVLTMPVGEAHDARTRLMRAGIEEHFGVSVVDETRLVDAYAMTAPDGAGPDLKYVDDGLGGGIGACSMEYVSGLTMVTSDGVGQEEGAIPETGEHDLAGLDIEALRARFSTLFQMRREAAGAAIGGLNASWSSIDDLCRMLEMHLGRPVVNETQLLGRYDCRIDQTAPGTEAFLRRLRDRAGLVLTPASRDVAVIVVRERQDG